MASAVDKNQRFRRAGDSSQDVASLSDAIAKKTAKSIYHCDYCNTDLSSTHRIRCAECEDFDLCLQCFSVGNQTGKHKNTHKYRVLEPLDFPILDTEWTAGEELLLLEGIGLWGIGNWPEISNHVITKTKRACEQHYYFHYIDSTNGKLVPDLSRAKSKTELVPLKMDPTKLSALDVNDYECDSGVNTPRSGRGARAGTPLSDAGGAGGGGDEPRRAVRAKKGPRAKADREAAGGRGGPSGRSVPKDPGAQGAGRTGRGTMRPDAYGVSLSNKLPGYMPSRGDFDTEYDNDAEEPLVGLTFEPTDSEFQREIKFKMIEMYNWRLDERMKRKAFLIDRGLVDPRKELASERKRTRMESDVNRSLRPLTRLHSSAEHNELLRGLSLEEKVRARIAELQQWKLIGLKTLEEGELYEEERRNRLRLAKGGDVAYLDPVRSAEETSFSRAQRRGRRSGEGAGGGGGAADDNVVGGATTGKSSMSPARESRTGTTPRGSPAASGKRRVLERGLRDEDNVTPQDVKRMKGGNELSPAEIDACIKLSMTPQRMLAAKHAVLVHAKRQHDEVGQGVGRRIVRVVDVTPAAPPFTPTKDKNASTVPSELLVSIGWLPSENDPRLLFSNPPGYSHLRTANILRKSAGLPPLEK